MAKPRDQKRTKQQSRRSRSDRSNSESSFLRSLRFPDSYLLILSGLAALAYFLFSLQSQGLLSDEEISHYQACLQFFRNPAGALNYWSRPGFTLVYSIPALFGHGFLVAAMCLTAAFTAYFTARVAQCLEVKNYILSFIFVAFAPLLFQISHRPYTELFAALLIALVLFFYIKDRFLACALICSFLFTVRQEYAVVAIIMGILFLSKKRPIPFVALGTFPLLLALLGFIKTGNPLWLLTDYMYGSGISQLDIERQGFWHYAKMFFAVFGTAGGALAVVGFLGFSPVRVGGGGWGHLKRYHVLYIIGTCVFLLQSILSSNLLNSPSPGKLTYIIPMVSTIGIFANLGFNFLWHARAKHRLQAAAVLTGILIVIFAYLSLKHNHLFFLDEADYSGALVLAALLIVSAALFAVRAGTPVAIVLIAALTIGHTLYLERPLPPNAEHLAVGAVADWHREHGLEHSLTLVNHPYFYFKVGALKSDPMYQPLRLETLENAPSGSIIIWDSHYGFHPRRSFDVPQEVLSSHPDQYRLLKKATASETTSQGGKIVRFGIWAYGKL